MFSYVGTHLELRSKLSLETAPLSESFPTAFIKTPLTKSAATTLTQAYISQKLPLNAPWGAVRRRGEGEEALCQTKEQDSPEIRKENSLREKRTLPPSSADSESVSLSDVNKWWTRRLSDGGRLTGWMRTLSSSETLKDEVFSQLTQTDDLMMRLWWIRKPGGKTDETRRHED